MTLERLMQLAADVIARLQSLIAEPATYIQLGIVVAVYIVARLIAGQFRRLFPTLTTAGDVTGAHPLGRGIRRSNKLIVPLLALVLLRISVDVGRSILDRSCVVQIVLALTGLLVFYLMLRGFAKQRLVAALLVWVVFACDVLHLD